MCDLLVHVLPSPVKAGLQLHSNTVFVAPAEVSPLANSPYVRKQVEILLPVRFAAKESASVILPHSLQKVVPTKEEKIAGY